MAGKLPAVLMLAALWGTAIADSGPSPDVTVELLAVDPASAAVVPPYTVVHGHIRYTTDAPVRLVLKPYRNGQPVLDNYNGGSPTYAAGSGETVAWFGFDKPQSIDEVRAVAVDGWGTAFAEASLERTIVWQAGAAAPAKAGWVEPLKQAPKNIVVAEPPPESASDWLLIGVVQMFFLCVPLSVILQIYAWRKFEGGLNRLARISGWLMAALWLFVLVTGLAGSNLSPIWLVFLSPLFVVYLSILLVRHRRMSAALA